MKNRTVALTVACSVIVGVSHAAADLVLCERGKSASTAIVLPDNPRPSAKYAAEELQRYICKMTGVKLSVSGNDNGESKVICFRQTDEYGVDRKSVV